MTVLWLDDGKRRATVLTDALGEHPVRHHVPMEIVRVQMSVDGRFIAVLSADNAVHLIDTARGLEQRMLAAPVASDRLLAITDMSSGRVGWADRGPDGRFVLTVHDLANGTTSTAPLGAPDVLDVFLPPDPDAVVVATGTDDDPVATVRSLTSGTVLRQLGESWLIGVRHEFTCLPGEARSGSRSWVVAYDLVTGAERHRVPLRGDCRSYWLSSDLRHVLERAPSPGDADHWRATEIESGRVVQFRTPRQPDSPRSTAAGDAFKNIMLRTAPDGVTVALVTVLGTLLRVRTTPEPELDLSELVNGHVAPAGDEAYLVVTSTGASTYERATGRRIAGIERERGDTWLVEDDELWFIRRVGDHLEITRHRLPTLTATARFALLPSSPEPFGLSVASPGDGEEIVVELADGALRAYDARSGAPLGPPVELADAPEEHRWFREHRALIPLTDETHLTLVSTPDGSVQLWDVRAGELLQELPVTGAAYGSAAASADRLVVNRTVNEVEIWDLTSGQRIGEPMPTPDIGAVIGFDAQGRLVTTVGQGDQRIVLYDVERRVDVATLWPAGRGEVRVADDAEGYVARGEHGFLPIRIPASVDRWRDHLCSLLPPELSPQARDLLPPGVDPSSPCAG